MLKLNLKLAHSHLISSKANVVVMCYPKCHNIFPPKISLKTARFGCMRLHVVSAFSKHDMQPHSNLLVVIFSRFKPEMLPNWQTVILL